MAEKRICVIGLGRFGTILTKRLASDGHEVIAIDNDQSHVDKIKDHVDLAVRADGTDKEVLRSVGVDEVDYLIIAIGTDFEAAQLALVAANDLGVTRTFVRANDEVKATILNKLGADRVILPEEEAAERLAKTLSLKHIEEVMELSKEFSIVKVGAPRKLVGRAMKDLALREKYEVNLIAIQSIVTSQATMVLTRKEMQSRATRPDKLDVKTMIPTGLSTIHNNDTLILVGKDSDIDRMLTEFQ